MFCCCAKIVLKCSKCEQKFYPSYNLHRFLSIWKDNVPICGSIAISAPIEVFILDVLGPFQKAIRYGIFHLQQRNRATLFQSRNWFTSSIPNVKKTPILYIWCNALFHFLVQCGHHLRNQNKGIYIVGLMHREIIFRIIWALKKRWAYFWKGLYVGEFVHG